MSSDSDEDTVCLDESFFVDRNYEVCDFTFGSHALHLYCLRSASTDYDLTGQLVWPGAVLMNNYLSTNAEMLAGRSVIELGSGVGITGILCSRFCRKVVLTDHNEEVLEIIKKNIELQSSSGNPISAELGAEKLEWGDSNQIREILQKHPKGFDFILGADIYILYVIMILLAGFIAYFLFRGKFKFRFPSISLPFSIVHNILVVVTSCYVLLESSYFVCIL